MDFALANALGRAVELKDMPTAAHTWRVTMYAQALGEASGLSTSELLRFMTGAVLHDIGKLDIPDKILMKPGRLDEAEYTRIKTHAALGYDRLQRLGEEDSVVLNVVRHHHERLDGSGYPDGLKGDDIPIEARRFSIIDGFDAMTSLRPYRSDVGVAAAHRALDELRAHSGSWYDAEAVDTFDALFQAGQLHPIMHHLNDATALEELTGPGDDETFQMADEAIRRSNPPSPQDTSQHS